MPAKREAIVLDVEEPEGIQPRLYEVYRFGNADLVVLVHPPGPLGDQVVEQNLEEADSGSDVVQVTPTSNRNNRSPTQAGNDGSATQAPILYLLHQQKLCALSSVFEDLIDEAAGGNASEVAGENARKRARTTASQSGQGRLRLEITERQSSLDALLPYFYRGRGHTIPLPDLATFDFDQLLNVLHAATRWKVTIVQDMLEERF